MWSCIDLGFLSVDEMFDFRQRGISWDIAEVFRWFETRNLPALNGWRSNKPWRIADSPGIALSGELHLFQDMVSKAWIIDYKARKHRHKTPQRNAILHHIDPRNSTNIHIYYNHIIYRIPVFQIEFTQDHDLWTVIEGCFTQRWPLLTGTLPGKWSNTCTNGIHVISAPNERHDHILYRLDASSRETIDSMYDFSTACIWYIVFTQGRKNCRFGMILDGKFLNINFHPCIFPMLSWMYRNCRRPLVWRLRWHGSATSLVSFGLRRWPGRPRRGGEPSWKGRVLAVQIGLDLGVVSDLMTCGWFDLLLQIGR